MSNKNIIADEEETKLITDEEETKQDQVQEDSEATLLSETHGNVALRTVPVYLTNENRKLKVNALLDDASTKTYINADVATELGLQGHPQRVTVSVLNGKVETFKLSVPWRIWMVSQVTKLQHLLQRG